MNNVFFLFLKKKKNRHDLSESVHLRWLKEGKTISPQFLKTRKKKEFERILPLLEYWIGLYFG